MRVGVYIDGFNLFYGLKRFERPGVNYRWLDPLKLARRLRPNDGIELIKYFTARVDARHDVYSPQRQDTYLRALETTPQLSIHQGEFRTDKRMMRLVNPPDRASPMVNVWRTEEKGSDVSLATHLVADGFSDRFDLAIIISNDSDLIEPITVVQNELGLRVGVFNPQRGFSSRLRRSASFYTQIQEADFSASQFCHSISTRMAARFINRQHGM